MEDLIRGGMDLARPILDRAIHEKFEAEQIIGKPMVRTDSPRGALAAFARPDG
jgi:hypothetical protein